MLVRFVFEDSLKTQHLVPFCFLVSDYLRQSKLYSVLVHILFYILTKLPLVCVAFEWPIVYWLWRKVLSVYPSSDGPEKSSRKSSLKLGEDLELVEVMKSIILLLL